MPPELALSLRELWPGSSARIRELLLKVLAKRWDLAETGLADEWKLGIRECMNSQLSALQCLPQAAL